MMLQKEYYKELNVYSKSEDNAFQIYQLLENSRGQYCVVMFHQLPIDDSFMGVEDLKFLDSTRCYYYEGIADRLNGEFTDDWQSTIEEAINYYQKSCEN